MLARRLKLSSSAILASFALLFAACGEGTDAPGTMTAGTGSMPTAGTTNGGGSISSSGAGASSAGTASAGAAGTPNTGGGGANGAAGAGGLAGGGNGGAAGLAGAGGTSGGSGGAAGSGGAGGSSAGAGGAPAFQPCPATGACIIMPFGDSITQGFNVAGGYRAPLYKLATAANRNITFVGSRDDYAVANVPKNHEGHGGYTIEGNNGISQFVGTSIPNYKPDIITLMIGTNDINGNNNVADAPNRLGKLLDAIFMRDANILVVLAQMVPTGSDGTNNAVKTYNAAMPNLVSTRVAKGQHIVLVDMYTAFTKNASYKTALLGDNLHPNQTGYNLMADVWFQALNPYLH